MTGLTIANYLGASLELLGDDDAQLNRELLEGVLERPLVEEFCHRVERAVASGSCTVVDVGAHVGLYSILAARRGASVIALEPNPVSAALLMRNARANGVESRVRVERVAAGASDSAAWLNISRVPCAHHVIHVEADNALAIDVRRLDTIVAALGIRPSIIKIDAEGMDYDVLCGAADTLRACDPWVSAELFPAALQRLQRSPDEFLARARRSADSCEFLPHDSMGPARALRECAPELLAGGGNLLLSCWSDKLLFTDPLDALGSAEQSARVCSPGDVAPPFDRSLELG